MNAHGLISDEWLVSYAAGALPDAHALIVASHAHYHPALQKRIDIAEEIGGEIICSGDKADISPTLLEDTMAKLESFPEAINNPKIRSKKNTDTDLPECLRDYLDDNLDDLKWRIMGPGMKQVKLATGPKGEKLWLLRARGGTKIPQHDHNGLELTLILRGSYNVDGHDFMPGDIEIADQDIRDHQPMINEGEDCICLVVTEAPIRIQSLMGRMMQPFIGL
ncbi:ChrR family anti-sigma-E factor [Kordiimonas sp. SCSIO 12603]|uniref:ChrR family anti-sigma-E factor n=1 Tax=Kordiimonas sp. SCSIO 12603 TaxID=2829596 RepID=UPI002101ED3E|nr:ChrR family anti-sigma-E factor [Kordiimonas sp. SCSIO 12603]UTW57833.1 ChrR family anti-sigma-E factor [Kordiimonas sp. SCSIO 12603]